MIILTPIGNEVTVNQEQYELLLKLVQSGIFDMQVGKFTINIAFGEIKNIVKEEMIWHKK